MNHAELTATSSLLAMPSGVKDHNSKRVLNSSTTSGKQNSKTKSSGNANNNSAQNSLFNATLMAMISQKN